MHFLFPNEPLMPLATNATAPQDKRNKLVSLR